MLKLTRMSGKRGRETNKVVSRPICLITVGILGLCGRLQVRSRYPRRLT